MIEIAIHNEQNAFAVDVEQLRQAVHNVLDDRHVESGEISLAIINDQQMQVLNARYLDHDWPTDVLSFVHESDEHRLEGEIIVSADTALREARRYGWRPADELLLYIIHGALHLIGYDDHNQDDLADMRNAERRHLRYFGLTPRYLADDIAEQPSNFSPVASPESDAFDERSTEAEGGK